MEIISVLIENDCLDFTCKVSLARTSKVLYRKTLSHIDQLKKNYLAEKYSAYQDLSVDSFHVFGTHKKIVFDGIQKSIDASGILLDFLFSGCDLPFAKHSLPFPEKLENFDRILEEILKFFPDSVAFSLGEMRCRRFITPLVAAIYNPLVSVENIEMLLKNGANPNTFIKRNNDILHICNDSWAAKVNFFATDRNSKIFKLLLCYGSDTNSKRPSEKQLFMWNFQQKEKFDQ